MGKDLNVVTTEQKLGFKGKEWQTVMQKAEKDVLKKFCSAVAEKIPCDVENVQVTNYKFKTESMIIYFTVCHSTALTKNDVKELIQTLSCREVWDVYYQVLNQKSTTTPKEEKTLSKVRAVRRNAYIYFFPGPFWREIVNENEDEIERLAIRDIKKALESSKLTDVEEYRLILNFTAKEYGIELWCNASDAYDSQEIRMKRMDLISKAEFSEVWSFYRDSRKKYISQFPLQPLLLFNGGVQICEMKCELEGSIWEEVAKNRKTELMNTFTLEASDVLQCDITCQDVSFNSSKKVLGVLFTVNHDYATYPLWIEDRLTRFRFLNVWTVALGDKTQDLWCGIVVESEVLPKKSAEETFSVILRFPGSNWETIAEKAGASLKKALVNDLHKAVNMDRSCFVINALTFEGLQVELTVTLPAHVKFDTTILEKIMTSRFVDTFGVYQKRTTDSFIEGGTTFTRLPTVTTHKAIFEGVEWKDVLQKKSDNDLQQCFTSDIVSYVDNPPNPKTVSFSANETSITVDFVLGPSPHSAIHLDEKYSHQQFTNLWSLYPNKQVVEREIHVCSTHTIQFPGEQWTRLVATIPEDVKTAFVKDVMDALNVPESSLLNVVLTDSLFVSFDFDHKSNVSEDEINSKLGVFGYPRVWALYAQHHGSDIVSSESGDAPRSGVTTRHRVRFEGSSWGALLGKDTSALRKAFVSDVAQSLEVERSSVTSVVFTLGSLVVDFEVNHSEQITRAVIDEKLSAYSYPRTWELYIGSLDETSVRSVSVTFPDDAYSVFQSNKKALENAVKEDFTANGGGGSDHLLNIRVAKEQPRTVKFDVEGANTPALPRDSSSGAYPKTTHLLKYPNTVTSDHTVQLDGSRWGVSVDDRIDELKAALKSDFEAELSVTPVQFNKISFPNGSLHVNVTLAHTRNQKEIDQSISVMHFKKTWALYLPSTKTRHRVRLEGEDWDNIIENHYGALEKAFVEDLCTSFSVEPSKVSEVHLTKGSLVGTFALETSGGESRDQLNKTLEEANFVNTWKLYATQELQSSAHSASGNSPFFEDNESFASVQQDEPQSLSDADYEPPRVVAETAVPALQRALLDEEVLTGLMPYERRSGSPTEVAKSPTKLMGGEDGPRSPPLTGADLSQSPEEELRRLVACERLRGSPTEVAKSPTKLMGGEDGTRSPPLTGADLSQSPEEELRRLVACERLRGSPTEVAKSPTKLMGGEDGPRSPPLTGADLSQSPEEELRRLVACERLRGSPTEVAKSPTKLMGGEDGPRSPPLTGADLSQSPEEVLTGLTPVKRRSDPLPSLRDNESFASCDETAPLRALQSVDYVQPRSAPAPLSAVDEDIRAAPAYIAKSPTKHMGEQEDATRSAPLSPRSLSHPAVEEEPVVEVVSREAPVASAPPAAPLQDNESFASCDETAPLRALQSVDYVQPRSAPAPLSAVDEDIRAAPAYIAKSPTKHMGEQEDATRSAPLSPRSLSHPAVEEEPAVEVVSREAPVASAPPAAPLQDNESFASCDETAPLRALQSVDYVQPRSAPAPLSAVDEDIRAAPAYIAKSPTKHMGEQEDATRSAPLSPRSLSHPAVEEEPAVEVVSREAPVASAPPAAPLQDNESFASCDETAPLRALQSVDYVQPRSAPAPLSAVDEDIRAAPAYIAKSPTKHMGEQEDATRSAPLSPRSLSHPAVEEEPVVEVVSREAPVASAPPAAPLQDNESFASCDETAPLRALQSVDYVQPRSAPAPLSAVDEDIRAAPAYIAKSPTKHMGEQEDATRSAPLSPRSLSHPAVEEEPAVEVVSREAPVASAPPAAPLQDNESFASCDETAPLRALQSVDYVQPRSAPAPLSAVDEDIRAAPAYIAKSPTKHMGEQEDATRSAPLSPRSLSHPAVEEEPVVEVVSREAPVASAPPAAPLQDNESFGTVDDVAQTAGHQDRSTAPVASSSRSAPLLQDNESFGTVDDVAEAANHQDRSTAPVASSSRSAPLLQDNESFGTVDDVAQTAGHQDRSTAPVASSSRSAPLLQDNESFGTVDDVAEAANHQDRSTAPVASSSRSAPLLQDNESFGTVDDVAEAASHQDRSTAPVASSSRSAPLLQDNESFGTVDDVAEAANHQDRSTAPVASSSRSAPLLQDNESFGSVDDVAEAAGHQDRSTAPVASSSRSAPLLQDNESFGSVDDVAEAANHQDRSTAPVASSSRSAPLLQDNESFGSVDDVAEAANHQDRSTAPVASSSRSAPLLQDNESFGSVDDVAEAANHQDRSTAPVASSSRSAPLLQDNESFGSVDDVAQTASHQDRSTAPVASSSRSAPLLQDNESFASCDEASPLSALRETDYEQPHSVDAVARSATEVGEQPAPSEVVRSASNLMGEQNVERSAPLATRSDLFSAEEDEVPVTLRDEESRALAENRDLPLHLTDNESFASCDEASPLSALRETDYEQPHSVDAVARSATEVGEQPAPSEVVRSASNLMGEQNVERSAPLATRSDLFSAEEDEVPVALRDEESRALAENRDLPLHLTDNESFASCDEASPLSALRETDYEQPHSVDAVARSATEVGEQPAPSEVVRSASNLMGEQNVERSAPLATRSDLFSAEEDEVPVTLRDEESRALAENRDLPLHLTDNESFASCDEASPLSALRETDYEQPHSVDAVARSATEVGEQPAPSEVVRSASNLMGEQNVERSAPLATRSDLFSAEEDEVPVALRDEESRALAENRDLPLHLTDNESFASCDEASPLSALRETDYEQPHSVDAVARSATEVGEQPAPSEVVRSASNLMGEQNVERSAPLATRSDLFSAEEDEVPVTLRDEESRALAENPDPSTSPTTRVSLRATRRHHSRSPRDGLRATPLRGCSCEKCDGGGRATRSERSGAVCVQLDGRAERGAKRPSGDAQRPLLRGRGRQCSSG
ncbi:hypothetical protein, conserved [Angomonas deanei]|uniref:Flagellar attachment zone protein 1 conserved domain-containing protein n=1 Tax=Angomonas deanei TaxID=59799 RepID=A0A7G2CSJ4_9TRYP|nr:hypothetical protein, conserved [Angomonas deanei]